MSLSDLQSWLVNEGLKEDLPVISVLLAANEIGGIAAKHEISQKSSEFDWERLLLAGSILAKSTQRSHVEAVLQIAIAALSLQDSISIKDAGAILLQKVANHRSVQLAEARGLLEPELVSRLGIKARLDAAYRNIDKSVLLSHTGDWFAANQFQQEFWQTVNAGNLWVSASAPTASGKTFLVIRWLIDYLLTEDAKIAIYLAPTRALVTEIEAILQHSIKTYNIENMEISTLPLASALQNAVQGKKKTVFVFTQERLNLFLNTAIEHNIEVIVVDEAHKIGDAQRGVILQSAVERAVSINRAARVLYLSPATQNPELLLEDAPVEALSRAVDSDSPTVLQNIIIAEQQPRMPLKWKLSLRQNDGFQELGLVDLENRPMGSRKRLAFLAAAIGEKGGTLIYVNGAAEAEKVALLISQVGKNLPEKPDSDLRGVIDLARKGVHRSYLLASVIRKGVAFHYGNMPALLRIEIERLFKIGKIRYLVCTSTLIEGVNLSCRTIVMRGPRKGRGKPMEPHDFWNLAGRAGRWGDEFAGNIICVDPSDREAWPNGVPERLRYPIKRETDSVLSQGDAVISFINRRMTASTKEVASNPQLEQVSAYLISIFMSDGTLQNAPLAKRHDADFIDRLETSLKNITDKIEIPVSIATRNVGVSAAGLQNLFVYFKSRKGDIIDLLPAPPESGDVWEALVKIMHRINSHVYATFDPPSRVPLYAHVVTDWLKGRSLAFIIASRIKYHEERKQPYRLPDLIRGTMELVEQFARFRAPKFLSAYMDVLNYYLSSIGRADLIQEDLDFGVYLEFGLSTTTLLSLTELGLSRMSAAALYEIIAQDNLDQAQCRSWVVDHEADIDGLDLPIIVIREIKEKLLGHNPDQNVTSPAEN